MAKKVPDVDLAHLGDDKALAIAAYGEAVAAYRYIVLAEKSAHSQLRASFEAMAQDESRHRAMVQDLLRSLFADACFYLDNRDKSMVCVGPRLVDARDEPRLDEAMKITIASEKRTASFYARYAPAARHGEVRHLFESLAEQALARVRRLRQLFHDSGKHIVETCPIQ